MGKGKTIAGLSVGIIIILLLGAFTSAVLDYFNPFIGQTMWNNFMQALEWVVGGAIAISIVVTITVKIILDKR
ncbi:MAG: hypothetical protein ACRECH_16255 [Nitrososphaerales archaeon]